MQDRFERFVVSITELHRYLQKLKELEMGQMDLKAGYTMCLYYLGSAKDRVHFDIVLDDAIHNILESKAEYPVLMRKPWNAKMTGLLSVNTMAEFVSLVKQIMKASTSKTEKITAPAVLGLSML